MALAVRVPRTGRRMANPGLAVAIAVSAALQIAGVLLPPLRTLLGTDSLTAAELLACAAAAALPGLALWAVRRQ